MSRGEGLGPRLGKPMIAHILRQHHGSIKCFTKHDSFHKHVKINHVELEIVTEFRGH